MQQLNLFEEEIENKDAGLTAGLYEVITILETEKKKTEKAWQRFHEYKLSLLSKDKITVENIRELIKFSKKLRQLKGQHRQIIQGEIFCIFKYITSCLMEIVELRDIPVPFTRDKISGCDVELQRRFIIIRDIIDSCEDTLKFKGARGAIPAQLKANALELLVAIFVYVRCRKLWDIVIRSLGSRNRTEREGALDALLHYYYLSDDAYGKEQVAEALEKFLKPKPIAGAGKALRILSLLGKAEDYPDDITVNQP
ncbi:MAG: hypothetical protein GY765_01470 [bacterium]|nr:hypothetical protein [bacterium]